MKQYMRKKSLLSLTLFAFVINAIIPFVAVYHPSSAQASIEDSEVSSLFGDKILICTADGFKWVSWEELGNEQEQEQGEHPEPGKGHYECPLCYVSAHSTKDFLPRAQIVPARAIIEKQPVHLHFSDDVLQTRFAAHAYQSRAPPYSA